MANNSKESKQWEPVLNKNRFLIPIPNHVRLSKVRGVFDKRNEQTFTDQIVTIDQCIPGDPPVYKIKVYDGEQIICSFYDHELQKIGLVKDKLYPLRKFCQNVNKGDKFISS